MDALLSASRAAFVNRSRPSSHASLLRVSTSPIENASLAAAESRSRFALSASCASPEACRYRSMLSIAARNRGGHQARAGHPLTAMGSYEFRNLLDAVLVVSCCLGDGIGG